MYEIETTMSCIAEVFEPKNKLSYQILGGSMQVLEICLAPKETVIAEAGTMNYMQQGIKLATVMGDGSDACKGFVGKICSAGRRVLTGESIFMTHFTNNNFTHSYIGFSAPYPGEIIPINLSELNNELLCQKSAFLCAEKGTAIGIAFIKRFGVGFFGGEGFILQRLQGNGLAFIHAGGKLIRKELQNETIYIDTGCIIAFTNTLDYSIEKIGSIKSTLFSGESRFLAKLSGTGIAFLQSMPFARLADRVISATSGGKGEGYLGRIGNFISG